MPRRLRSSVMTARRWLRFLVLVACGAAAAALWLSGVSPPGSRAAVVWHVELGLFPALLTALTIVFAVTVTPQPRWPSFGDLVAAIAVRSWLAVAIGGILCAAV